VSLISNRCASICTPHRYTRGQTLERKQIVLEMGLLEMVVDSEEVVQIMGTVANIKRDKPGNGAKRRYKL